VGEGTVGQNGDQGPADGGGMEGGAAAGGGMEEGPTKRQSNSPVVDSDNHLEKVVQQ
jgi:hypothetical protein